METIKSYTDISQSKTLADILPLESADMNYWCGEQIRIGGHRTMDKDLDIPCWSLAALLSVIPYYPVLNRTTSGWRCDVYNEWGFMFQFGERSDNPVDACVAMIIHLHELNLL